MKHLMMVCLVAGAAAAGEIVRDPAHDIVARIGELGEAEGATLEAAARNWLRSHGAGMGIAEPGAATLVDVQDGTPVRMARFRMLPNHEVAVVFGQGLHVIGCSTSPGPRPPHPLTKRQPIVAPLASAGVSLKGRVAVLPGGAEDAPGLGKGWPKIVTQDVSLADLVSPETLSGTHFETVRLAGERTKASAEGHLRDPQATVEKKRMQVDPGFLEATAYHHATRSRAAVAAYGAGARYDALVGRIRLIVDQTHTQSGRPLEGNAFYSSNDNALHFAALDAFPSAADPSIVAHEMGHAVWRALVGAEPEKPVELDEMAVYEGHADAFAALVTGDPVVGHQWLGPKEERNCQNDRQHEVNRDTYQHELGQVYSGLLYSLKAGRDATAWRNLILGSVQLAPRPITPASLVAGLLLADRFFNRSANAQDLLRVCAERQVPFKPSSF